MRAALAIALLLAAAPVQAQERGPGVLEAAAEARLAGDPQRAVRLLEPYLAQRPDDVDARLQYAYALLALGRADAAGAQFEAVLAAAPDYADARDGLALVAARRASPDARRATLLVEGALADVGGQARDWREAGAVLSLPFGDDALELGGRYYSRFGLEDAELGAGFTHRAGPDGWLRAGIGVTPAADFRPEVSARIGYDRRIAAGLAATVVGVDAGWRRFPVQDVWNVSPALTRYFGDGGISVTVRADAVLPQGDDLRFGGSLRGDYAPADRLRAFAGIAAGPDTDLGIVTDTYSVFGGGEVPLGDALSLTGALSREWRDGPADRTEFRLGLKARL